MIGFDPLYFLAVAPAMLLAFWAQGRVRHNYAVASQVPAPLSGAATARHLLDSAGLQAIAIEPVAGQLTDHYDPSAKVLRLSEGVYGHRNMAAVGIAAHEAGHALQDAHRYAPLVVRNLAVPLANFGGSTSMILIMIGAMTSMRFLIPIGIIAFSAMVLFQLVNLPVEFDASSRAKKQLLEHRIVSQQDMQYVSGVLNSAAWTYVAATLSAVLTLLYLVLRFGGGGSSDER
jgi:uncharacterized protein